MKKDTEKQREWEKKTPEEKAKVYDTLADQTNEGHMKNTYIRLAKSLRENGSIYG